MIFPLLKPILVVNNVNLAMLFAILRIPEANVLAKLPTAQFREARKLIVTAILATDMAKHGEIVSKMKDITETFNFDDANHRMLLVQLIIKCADISNEVRPTIVSEKWVTQLLNEFFHQSDTEKSKGLPFAPFMDRDKVTKSGAQVGFIGFVMLPLFEVAAKVLPSMDTGVLPQIREALTYYKSLNVAP